MSAVHPTVRYLIVCDDVQIDPLKGQRISLIGLVGNIQSREEPAFPMTLKELCVFLQLIECRGPADGRIEIQHADSGELVFRTQTHTIPLGTDPLTLVGFVFRLRNCVFPEAGLYWFQFWYNDEMLAQQPVLLR